MEALAQPRHCCSQLARMPAAAPAHTHSGASARRTFREQVVRARSVACQPGCASAQSGCASTLLVASTRPAPSRVAPL
eukprot:1877489-Alexandrium_andersonii.AAC.1